MMDLMKTHVEIDNLMAVRWSTDISLASSGSHLAAAKTNSSMVISVSESRYGNYSFQGLCCLV